MSAIQAVGSFDTQMLARAQQQVTASRTNEAREASSASNARRMAAEESSESAAERASEGSSEGMGGSLNVVA